MKRTILFHAIIRELVLLLGSGALFFSILGAAAVLIFFIAGLLYLLRFERVDNLGAYRIPSETGFLIPSDYINYRKTGRTGATRL